jgi:hypothetical protein
MGNVAKTLHKFEAKADPLFGGAVQKAYGKHRGVDTGNGYEAGKEQKFKDEAGKQAKEQADAAVEAARVAEESVTNAKHDSQVNALKRKGRRALILTDPTESENQLGSTGM